MKKLILLMVCLALGLSLLAQGSPRGIDDLIFGEEKEETEDSGIIQVRFQKKDARRAMVYSAILPGAGQFYADRSSFTTYLFPVLEVAMIGGIIYFYGQGNKKTDEFENFATGETVTHTFEYTVDGVPYSYTYTGPRYNRTYQTRIENWIKAVNAYDIYDDTFFRLDATNTQHFYEDIGKYNKYVFGWADWYHNFATDPRIGNNAVDSDGNPIDPCVFPPYDPNEDYSATWVWAGSDDPQLAHLRRWTSNIRIEDYLNGYLYPILPSTTQASAWRQEYIQMRKDANALYGYARLFTLGLAFNHIAAAVDAVLLTQKVNRMAITQSDFRLHYYTDLRDNQFTPMLGVTYSF